MTASCSLVTSASGNTKPKEGSGRAAPAAPEAGASPEPAPTPRRRPRSPPRPAPHLPADGRRGQGWPRPGTGPGSLGKPACSGERARTHQRGRTPALRKLSSSCSAQPPSSTGHVLLLREGRFLCRSGVQREDKTKYGQILPVLNSAARPQLFSLNLRCCQTSPCVARR